MEILINTAASSVLIGMVFIIRAVFEKKVSPGLLYLLWLPVALRLLMPGMLTDSPISMMNTGIWNAGTGFLTREYERQRQEEKEQKYQEYYSALQKQQEEDNAISQVTVNGENLAQEAPYEEREEGEPETVEQKTMESEIIEVETMEPEIIEWKKSPAGTFLGKLNETAKAVRLLGIVLFSLIFLGKNLSFYSRLYVRRTKWKEVRVGKRRISVFTVENQLSSPCLFGLFPAIYIPKEAVERKDTKAELITYIIEHELTHYRQGDHIWAFVRMLCLILNWYNPLVWIAARLSVRDGELACDAGCIKRLGEEKRYDYGEALLAMIKPACEKEQFFSYAAMMTTGKKFMKKRMDGIARKRKNSKAAAVLMVGLCLLCAGCTFTGASGEKETEEALKSETAQTAYLPAEEKEQIHREEAWQEIEAGQ